MKEAIDINQLDLEDVEEEVKVKPKVKAWNQTQKVLEELGDEEEKEEVEGEQDADS